MSWPKHKHSQFNKLETFEFFFCCCWSMLASTGQPVQPYYDKAPRLTSPHLASENVDNRLDAHSRLSWKKAVPKGNYIHIHPKHPLFHPLLRTKL